MTTEQVVALGIAFLIGMLLGVMGSGGSIITLPVLVYVAGIRPQSAVPMSLVSRLFRHRHKRFRAQIRFLRGKEPKFVKIIAAVRHRRRDVETWLNSCRS